MADERDVIRNLHTAMRRYVMERMNSFDQFQPQQGGVFTDTPALYDGDTFMEVMPRLFFLNSVRWELAAITPDTLVTLDETRELFDVAAQIARDWALGAENEPIAEKAVHQEYQAFSAYMNELSSETLRIVEPLPYSRALSKQEHVERLATFGQRWGVEVEDGWFARDYYPVIARPSTPDLPAMEAFEAEAIVAANGTAIVQRILNAHGIKHIHIFEESYPGIECEVSQLDLARAIPSIVGFAFSESLDWMIHTSWHGTVTIGGDWLLDAVKNEWQDWEEHVYEYFDIDAMLDENNLADG